MSYPPPMVDQTYLYAPPINYPPPQQYVVEQTYFPPPPVYYPPPTVYVTEEMVRPQTVIEVQAPRRRKRRGCTIL